MNDSMIYMVVGILRRLSEKDDLQDEMRLIADELMDAVKRYNDGETKPILIKDLIEGRFVGDDVPEIARGAVAK